MNDAEFERELRDAAAHVAGGPASRALHDRIAAVPTEYPRRRSRPRWLGLGLQLGGAVVTIVLVVAVAANLIAAGPQRNQGLGGATARPSPLALAGVRILSTQELGALLSSSYASVPGDVVIADVKLAPVQYSCVPAGSSQVSRSCQGWSIEGLSGVVVAGETGPTSATDGVFALRVQGYTELRLLGAVSPGPTGLAWTVAQASAPDGLAQVAQASASGAAPLAVIDGWLGVVDKPLPCPAPVPPATPGPYGCGHGEWLADASTEPADTLTRPAGSLPVTNGAFASFSADPSISSAQRGFYLIALTGHSCPVGSPVAACDFLTVVGRLDPIASLPGPSASVAPYPDGIPREIDGQPVLRPSDALARAQTATDDSPFLVGGWTIGYVQISCAPVAQPSPVSPLAPSCAGGWTLGEAPRAGMDTSTNLWNHLRNLHAVPLPVDPGAIVIRVHAHDPLAEQCLANIRPTCEQALVIEAVVWQAPAPSVGPTSEPSPSPSAASPTSGDVQTPSRTEIAAAKALVDAYTADLVKGDFAAAFEMLAADSRTRSGSLAAFTSERRASFQSVAGRYVVVASPSDVGPITNWLPATDGASIDLRYAVLVEVDYPALAGNNAGWDLYIVAPDANGALVLYDVR